MLYRYTPILAPNASMMTGPGTNTIIVGVGTEGVTVIDPADDTPAHLDAIVEAGKARGGIRRILITHGHPDHIGGASALRERLHVPIYAFSREGTPFADEEVPNGMTFSTGDDILRAIYTPGHRFDHHCYLLEQQHILLAGDLIAGIGTVVISPPEGELLDYLNSLKHLQALDLWEIVPAHGPSITNPQAKLAEYIAHRLQREQQVLSALETFPSGASIPILVERVYVDVDPSLHALAAHSLEAHLLKLVREDRVKRSGDTWILVQ